MARTAMKVATKKAPKDASESVSESEESPEMTNETVPTPQGKRILKKRPAAAAVAEIQEEADSESLTNEESSKQGNKRIMKRPAAAAAACTESEGEPDSEPRTKTAKWTMRAGFSPMVNKLSLELKKSRQTSAPPQSEPPKAAGRKVKEVVVAPEPSESDFKPEKPTKTPKVNKTQELINVIHRTINSIPYKAPPVAGVRLHPCVLTTVDEDGYPSMRTVVPSHMEADLSEIRVVTNIDTKKVQEIQKNKRVSVHYQDQRGRGGWVTLKGDAKILLKEEADAAEVSVRPDRCEVVSYMEGPTSADNGEGWKPAVLMRPNGGAEWKRTH